MSLVETWLESLRQGQESLLQRISDEVRRVERERDMAALDLAPHPEEPERESEHADLQRAGRVVAAAREALGLGIAEVWGKSHAAVSNNSTDQQSLLWIDGAIRTSSGLAWNSCEWGPGAKAGVDYLSAENPTDRPVKRKFQWCGAAAARIQAGAGLKQVIRTRCMAGTGRLWNCSSDPKTLSPKDAAYYMADARRRIAPDQGRPGDTALMGPQGSLAHIETVIDLIHKDGELVGYLTVGGNAHGLAADGVTPARGVVLQRRPVPRFAKDARTYRVQNLVRWLDSDYE